MRNVALAVCAAMLFLCLLKLDRLERGMDNVQLHVVEGCADTCEVEVRYGQ